MRTLLLMLLPILASGQIYIDSYRFGGAQLLLDAYPGAAAAYSFRLLDADYTGDCITLRRSSDNALDTFGFVNNYLDTTALKSFCGTGATDTCWVRIWFDQSGNTRNVTNTTNANQPMILASGNIIKDNGDLSLQFDGVNDKMDFTLSSNLSQPGTLFAAMRNITIGGNDKIVFSSNSSGSRWQLTLSSTSVLTIFAGNLLSTVGNPGTTQKLIYSLFNTTSSQIGWNGATSGNNYASGNAGSYQLSAISIGNIGTLAGFYADMYMHELIIYNSNQSSNRSGIESNINTFYSIY
jgi:hypothetical protein